MWNSGKIDHKEDKTTIMTLGSMKPAFLVVNDIEYNFSQNNYYFSFSIDNFEKTLGIELRFSEKNCSENYLYYRVPKFDDPEFNLVKPNRKTTLGISMANLQIKGKIPKSLNSLCIYINAKESRKFSLYKITHKRKRNPGIVSLTFDDGFRDIMIASKLMSKFNLEATAYIMPRDLGKKGYITKNESKTLQIQNGWDIQYHHLIPYTKMNSFERKKETDYTRNYLKEAKLSKGRGSHLAYPLGKWNIQVLKFVRNNLNTARLAGGGIETIPPADLHLLRVVNVLNSTTPEEIKELIKSTKDNNQWLILMFHYLKKEAKTDLEYSISNFKEILKIISDEEIDVMTVDQVWKKYLK
jgi:peptidoglycan/xylan/chitin deacetylase (PgdA/CDA1 family)